LKFLKSRVKIWSKEKRIQEKVALETLEESLATLYLQKAQVVDYQEIDLHLKPLEVEHYKLLLTEEERWRQKSREI